ncbi:unnamed protein product [Ceratitis capitata]|uniref:(Mediterranean fruit fly) hypothetical protein n=1 Tax=Ceratitis capitata TaxID=7213 RepID=A0A811UTN8_CERCA|nr:unnamed protein product [Ceratitis capitata]
MRLRRKIRFSVGILFQQVMFKRLLVFCLLCFHISAHLLAVHAAVRPPIERDAYTIYYKNQVANAKGDFHYEYQTSNGITTKVAGNEFGHSGVVQYISVEGIPITMTYVADANGYHPTGEHIPKLPEQVLATLQYQIERRPRTVRRENKEKTKTIIKRENSKSVIGVDRNKK